MRAFCGCILHFSIRTMCTCGSTSFHDPLVTVFVYLGFRVWCPCRGMYRRASKLRMEVSSCPPWRKAVPGVRTGSLLPAALPALSTDPLMMNARALPSKSCSDPSTVFLRMIFFVHRPYPSFNLCPTIVLLEWVNQDLRLCKLCLEMQISQCKQAIDFAYVGPTE